MLTMYVNSDHLKPTLTDGTNNHPSLHGAGKLNDGNILVIGSRSRIAAVADFPKLRAIMHHEAGYCPDQRVGGGAELLSQRKERFMAMSRYVYCNNLRWSLKH
jgi:hypothetical protein